jgi:hypothetical protein
MSANVIRAHSGSQPMTSTEFRACLATLDWSPRSLAHLIDRDERMVRRWGSGQYTIPDDVADWLATLAAFHDRHPPPRLARRNVT